MDWIITALIGFLALEILKMADSRSLQMYLASK
jgi:hypothetical protein